MKAKYINCNFKTEKIQVTFYEWWVFMSFNIWKYGIFIKNFDMKFCDVLSNSKMKLDKNYI